MPPNPYALLAEALAAELVRQTQGTVSRDGRRISLVGTVDLKALAFAAVHALSTTPGGS